MNKRKKTIQKSYGNRYTASKHTVINSTETVTYVDIRPQTSSNVSHSQHVYELHVCLYATNTFKRVIQISYLKDVSTILMIILPSRSATARLTRKLLVTVDRRLLGSMTSSTRILPAIAMQKIITYNVNSANVDGSVNVTWLFLNSCSTDAQMSLSSHNVWLISNEALNVRLWKSLSTYPTGMICQLISSAALIFMLMNALPVAYKPTYHFLLKRDSPVCVQITARYT